MREIKFRAWDSFKKKMYYEPFTIRTCKSGVIELSSPSYLQRWDGLMQYTGLKDKNGKEIYEGDIVRNGKTLFVEFGTWNCGCCSSVYGYNMGNWIVGGCGEVIGNIYENSELLKEEE